MASLELLAFPHAGGSAASLMPLRPHLAPALALRAVELPGRGVRLQEPLVTQRAHLVQQLCDELSFDLSQPYALFGHSLGATIAFELAHALIARGRPAPSALCVAAAPAPGVTSKRPSARGLDDAQLMASLRELGGTPSELFEHPELMELYLPIVRADFALCEGGSPRDLPQLPCPIHVYAGSDDRLRPEQLIRWRAHTRSEFSLSWFDGDHFFVRSRAPQLCALLRAQLLPGGEVPRALEAGSA